MVPALEALEKEVGYIWMKIVKEIGSHSYELTRDRISLPESGKLSFQHCSMEGFPRWKVGRTPF